MTLYEAIETAEHYSTDSLTNVFKAVQQDLSENADNVRAACFYQYGRRFGFDAADKVFDRLERS